MSGTDVAFGKRVRDLDTAGLNSLYVTSQVVHVCFYVSHDGPRRSQKALIDVKTSLRASLNIAQIMSLCERLRLFLCDYPPTCSPYSSSISTLFPTSTIVIVPFPLFRVSLNQLSSASYDSLLVTSNTSRAATAPR